jgi:hypothetical protein
MWRTRYAPRSMRADDGVAFSDRGTARATMPDSRMTVSAVNVTIL